MTSTPQKRLREYPNNCLSINKKNELFCDAFKKSIDYKKKSSVTQHLETEVHTSNSQKLKTVPNINFNTDEFQENFKNDLIIWLSASNVPFDKLNKMTFKSFLNNNLRPVFKIPSSATLRRSFPNLYKSKIDELKDNFSKSKVSVICDETTDSKCRYVFQIIFVKLDILKENCPKLVDTIFLDEVNYEIG
ncbi:unnamed protein product [Brachionus calyciflorus]|uniref:Uncharacterized protein n=1 Tax=Brachionus calyciflorus TaxID=104777 RepID=A0A814D044_9BILA|nr:unnamed protein product [Brachionus calyciflorus]